jgi:hypothetical protein
MENTTFYAIGCLMLMGTAILFIIAIIYFFRRKTKQANQVITEGKVISIQNRELGGINEDIDCPTVEFTTIEGETYQFESSFGSSSARYEVGQVVKVAYDSLHPEQAEISSTLTRFLIPAVLIFLMVVVLCLGVCFVTFGFLTSGAP